jgi:hypothetical protein
MQATPVSFALHFATSWKDFFAPATLDSSPAAVKQIDFIAPMN